MGHVDLLQIIASDIDELSSKEQAVILCVDSDPKVMVRSLILLSMIKDESVPIEEVLQAWFSTEISKCQYNVIL